MRNAERALFLDRDNITRSGAIWNHADTMNPGKIISSGKAFIRAGFAAQYAVWHRAAVGRVKELPVNDALHQLTKLVYVNLQCFLPFLSQIRRAEKFRDVI